MFGNIIHGKKTDLVEIVMEIKLSRILIKFTRVLVKSIRILVEIINSQSTSILFEITRISPFINLKI